MYYTGVGLEGFPNTMLSTMSDIAIKLNQMGFLLRTGFDDGACIAFWKGAEIGGRYDNISKIDFSPLALNIAKTVVYERDLFKWDCIPQDMKVLLARNVMLLLGRQCSSPSKFLLCWTPNGAQSPIHCSWYFGRTGYVGFLIEVARAYKIPVVNMHRPGWEDGLDKILAKLKKQGIY